MASRRSSSSSNGSSSSSDEDAQFLEYECRPDWNDVTPLYLQESEMRLINIAYSRKFKSTYAYMRALLEKNEMSERALRLSWECIKLNPANYTVWNYRRALLKHFNCNLYDEIELLNKITIKHPKNYQVWQHRKCMIESLKDTARELDFTKRMIRQDSKNYHAWQYRQWLIEQFNLFDGELEFVNQLLSEDVFNNSAWNHRYFILSKQKKLDEMRESEIDYCIEKISACAENESVWNYLRGLIPENEMSNQERIITFLEQRWEEHEVSRHLLSFYVDVLRDEYRKTGRPEAKTKALALVNHLKDAYDVIRKQYWTFVSGLIEQEQPASAAVQTDQHACDSNPNTL